MKKKPRAASAPVSTALLAEALRAQGEGVFIARRGAAARGLWILFANESFCAMTGYTAAELTGRPHGFLHTERSDVAEVARWQHAAKPGRPCLGEGYLVCKDGRTILAAWSFSAVRGARGKVTHIVATYRDMTEKRRMQESLVRSQRLDAEGRLAGGVAHDFNNLLSIINGYCEMLAAQVAEQPQALREVTEIHNAGRKAAALTRQLLAFGRRQPMDARVFNFNHLVRDNADVLGRLIGTVGRLELELTEHLGNVRADPAQFQQVLVNLILNARDALRDHGVVTISTTARDLRPGLSRRATDVPPGRYVCISVRDNGTGMNAETQRHLFEPFFTTKPEGRGTGLGLALVYGVVQQSGGFITVKSELLVGSTFEIYLPETHAPAESAAPAVAPLPVTRGHESVVLVEEDHLVRKMVAGILTADGYRVLAARSATEAQRLAGDHEQPVELLIASLGGECEQLAKALHTARPNLRVLCISNQEPPQTLAWLPDKHQAHLAKPFALSELLRSARTLLDA